MEITRKVQLHQVEMLKQLINVFSQEGLTYFAIGGTALGAVRHQGFIPWDDDIDIAMPRADYEKFLTLQSKLPKNFFIQNARTENNYCLYFSKVRDTNTLFLENRKSKYDINHGIFIDIFPWDEVDDIKKQSKLVRKLKGKYRRSIFPNGENRSLLSVFKWGMYKVFSGFKSSESLYEKLDNAHQMYNGSGTGKLGNAIVGEAIDLNDLYPLKYIKFEDIEIACPKNIEKYLSDKYGDYMTLPKVEDRVCHNPLDICLDLKQRG